MRRVWTRGDRRPVAVLLCCCAAVLLLFTLPRPKEKNVAPSPRGKGVTT